MHVLRFYRKEAEARRALQRVAVLYPGISIETELCYNVEFSGELRLLRNVSWVLSGKILHS